MVVFGGELSPLGDGMAFVELDLAAAVDGYREWGRGWRSRRRSRSFRARRSSSTYGALLPLEMPYRRRLLVGTTTDAYSNRRIRDRFTRELLLRYLDALGIHADDPAWYREAVLASD